MRLKELLLVMVLGFAGASPALTKPQNTSPRPLPPPDISLYDSPENPGAKSPSSVSSPADECDVSYKRGDCNRNGRLEVTDMIRLLNAVYLDSEGLYCHLCIADFNCDKLLTGLDAVWFVRYFYTASPTPRTCP